MNFYIISPLIILFSVRLYHFAQKSIPANADSWVIIGAICINQK